MHDSTAVRRAQRTDLDDVAETLAQAFVDDPLFEWLYADGATRLDRCRAFAAKAVPVAFRRGNTYTTADRQSFALWSPPDLELPGEDGVAIGMLLASQLGERMALVARGIAALDAHHPVEPHYYLWMVGVRPAARGRGAASRLLERALGEADADGVGAYLEATSERSVPLYERHGFRVVAEVPLPEGPVIRAMWRSPAAA